MAATTPPTTAVRFEGAPDDPLLRAEIAKREKAQQLRQNEADTAQSSEHQGEGDSSELTEGYEEAKEAGLRNRNESTDDPSRNPDDSKAKDHEKSLAQQSLLRSILCTRLAMPPAESVSDGVLQAVLVGDTDGLIEASRHERLKGVGVALRADDRKRTALHMAIGTKNARMVRALMRWRHELNHSLDDELDALDHRRDLFVQSATLASATATATAGVSEYVGTSVRDVERFEKWLFEERRRLVRVTEIRCEENWHKAMAARDDKGRTPVHWAASVNDADNAVLQTLLTTGRADLSARNATSRSSDASIMAALKRRLQGASSDGKGATRGSRDGVEPLGADIDGCAVFPRGDDFHRRTGKIRRRRRGGKNAESKGDSKGEENGEERNRHGGDSSAVVREGPDKMAGCTAKVKWFCGALASTAEKLSGRSKGGAEAFLLSVFEDFDRSGDGMLSMRQFRDALRDVNVTVSEQTLLDVGRYFRAPTSKSYRTRRQRDHRDSKHRHTRNVRDNANDCALVEVSYVPLMDVVFGRRSVRAVARGNLSKAERKTDGKTDSVEDRPQDDACQVTEVIHQPDTSSSGEDDGRNDEDCSFVNLRQLYAARTAAIEMTDALGRPPLFLAAASGAVSAAKTLIQHGAASAVAIDGTSITAHSVASSLLMKRVLATEARKSLDRAIAARANGDGSVRVTHDAIDDQLFENSTHHVTEVGEGRAVEPTDGDAIEGETRRMELWVSTLAEAELSSTRTSESLVDEKTSLHLAAAAGLPGAVKDLLERGTGTMCMGANISAHGMEATARPSWASSWPFPNGVLRETHNIAAHCADGHQVLRRDSAITASLKADTSGWSPLHACCAESSPEHYKCAVALLGSKQDPNARTNTGRTPLHIAACALNSGAPSAVYDVIPLLVSHGANMEAQDNDGLRPVHVAAKTGRHVALLALLTAGADPYTLTRRRWNALHYSVAGGHADATRLLAYWDSDYGALGSQRNSAGALPMDLGRTDEIRSVSPTIWEAAALGLADKVSRACSRSAEDRTGKPWACPGANKKTPGLGFTPLHACVAGLAAMTKRLDVSLPCSPPRPRSSRQGGASFVPRPSLYARLSCERSRPSHRCNRSVVPREHTGGTDQRRDHLGVCRALLLALADVDALDARCRTPLALAAASGDLEVVEMLLEAGAGPQASDTDGNTPAHFALAYANARIAAVLVKNGADLETCNKDGNNAQDVGGLCADVAPCERDVSVCR